MARSANIAWSHYLRFMTSEDLRDLTQGLDFHDFNPWKSKTSTIKGMCSLALVCGTTLRKPKSSLVPKNATMRGMETSHCRWSEIVIRICSQNSENGARKCVAPTQTIIHCVPFVRCVNGWVFTSSPSVTHGEKFVYRHSRGVKTLRIPELLTFHAWSKKSGHFLPLKLRIKCSSL